MEFKTEQGVIKPIIYVSVLRGDQILLVKYVTPPNPVRTGWWVPAPSLEFGEAPYKAVKRVLDGLGLVGTKFELAGVESFVSENGWHLIWHYTANASGEAAPSPEYECAEWFSLANLPPAEDFAHGKWERLLAERRLESKEPAAV